ncbi:MAG TPA: glycosyltransferase family 4 protein [Candidatus Acidoferrum sp.]|nr:glycosyltransferase family 4 protein [Candidatus Acidoferrum sp.]
MKLLLYSHYFAPSIGGVETIVLSLARGLAELRADNGSPEFELTLVTQTPRENFDDAALPFPVVRQPRLLQLMRLVRESDVVHLAGPSLLPLVLGFLARKPVVVEHHGFQVICPTGQLVIESKREPCPGHFMAGRRRECWNCDPALGWIAARKLWLMTFVRRWLCRRVSANVMPTLWLGEQLQLPNSATIHHGLTTIQAMPSRATHEVVPIVAFQGRLVSTKGATILLQAAKLLLDEGCELRILIIGDGPERTNLEGIAGEAPLAGRVRFAGRLAPAELENAFSSASVVVVPSLGGEVFGLVVAENMQRGLPVIASNLGAFVEVLGGAGEVFENGDVTELAKKLKEFVMSAARRKASADAGEKRARAGFSLKKMTLSHADLYRNVAKGN